MKPKGARHNTIPIPLGGQFSAGDMSMLPDGFVSLLRNHVIRPNRFDGRAPFVYDSLDDVQGFAIWKDTPNDLSKTVALKSSDNKLYTKNASGAGYTTGIAGVPASSRLTSWTNFLGKLWLAFDNGAGVPTSMAVYDGTSISAAPFNSTINARNIVTGNNRNFMTGNRVTISPAQFGNPTTLYFWGTVGAYWILTNVTAQLITTSSGKQISRIFPTSTTASSINYRDNAIAGQPTGWVNVPAAVTPSPFVWRSDLRSVSASYDMPITLEWVMLTRDWQAAHTYAAGDIQVATVAGADYIFRAVIAGASGGGVPAWSATLGANVIDNAVTWVNEGSAIIASQENFVPRADGSGNFSTYWLSVSVTPRTNAVTIFSRIKFFNTIVSTITLAPIDVAQVDGIADGDPSKKNYGQQATAGDFFYPFVNVEIASSSSQNIDAVIWCELENPKQILARNTFPLTEIAGISTASIWSNGRLVVFKRSGMWIFKGNADPYEPILPESPALSVGCIGPRALDVSRDNVLYWIGENHVYKMAVGSDSGPTAIDSPGMFEEMFARGGNWVESQSTYNMPLLAIDHANKDVWVYTQKGHIHVYSIQTGLWSYLDTNPTGSAAEVRAMIFDPVSNRMLVSFGGAAATRFDETSDAQDTIVTGGGTAWDIRNEIVPKPFELFASRYEATLLEVGLFHLATVQNGNLSIRYSYDRGVTYTTPDGYPVTAWLGNPRIRLPVTATGESVTIKLSRTGAGGSRNWSVSKADALLRVHRGESPKVNAT